MLWVSVSNVYIFEADDDGKAGIGDVFVLNDRVSALSTGF